MPRLPTPLLNLPATLRSLRFRLMMLNAIVVLLASMGTLVGLRTGMRFALIHELDEILGEDLEEIALAIEAVDDIQASGLYEEIDRKARGHSQHRWFAKIDSHWSVNAPDVLERKELDATTPISVAGFRVRDRLVRKVELDGNETNYRLRVGASAGSIERDLVLIDRIIEIAFALGLVIAPLGGYWLAGRATHPLAEIIRTADRLRPEELSERLPIRGTAMNSITFPTLSIDCSIGSQPFFSSDATSWRTRPMSCEHRWPHCEVPPRSLCKLHVPPRNIRS